MKDSKMWQKIANASQRATKNDKNVKDGEEH